MSGGGGNSPSSGGAPSMNGSGAGGIGTPDWGGANLYPVPGGPQNTWNGPAPQNTWNGPPPAGLQNFSQMTQPGMGAGAGASPPQYAGMNFSGGNGLALQPTPIPSLPLALQPTPIPSLPQYAGMNTSGGNGLANPFQMRQFPQFPMFNSPPPQIGGGSPQAGGFNFQQTPQVSQPNWAAISQLPSNGLPSIPTPPTPPPMPSAAPPAPQAPPTNPLASVTPQQQQNFVQGYGGTAPRFSDAWAAAPSMYPGLNNQNLFLQNMAQLQAGMPGMGG